jgi:hypothetical protein
MGASIRLKVRSGTLIRLSQTLNGKVSLRL